MAFATSNVKRYVFGTLNVVAGDWTGSVGDNAGSVTVEGARVYLAEFSIQDSTTPLEKADVYNASVGTTTTTLSIRYNRTVATGRFLVISA
jgi:hypothetical protein